jgi:hypothetical protein
MSKMSLINLLHLRAIKKEGVRPNVTGLKPPGHKLQHQLLADGGDAADADPVHAVNLI